ncbi:MAG: hypothetical protein D6731_10130 [Planctomycetota bacterium]|nr:MAG: hypothetical protein D6731_10130 [Planctomycetota bacterium]
MAPVLATLTAEVTVVSLVVGILLLASLVALAPLRRLRLPYTVALMLCGAALGGLGEQVERRAAQAVARAVLERTPLGALAKGMSGTARGDWRVRLDPEARARLAQAARSLPPGAGADGLAEALSAAEPPLVEAVDRALRSEGDGELPTEERVGLLEQFLHLVGAGGGLGPGMIFFVFLPPLVFESAFNLDARKLMRNLAPVLVLAGPVLVVAAGGTGAAAMLAGGGARGLTWEAAFLFGALISATDPVAVVALFKDLGAPARLGVLVEGESLFNDGTAIVLFHILLGLAVASYAPAAGAGEALSATIGHGLVEFLRVSLGGVAVGLALAWAVFWLVGRVTSNEHVEISLSVVLAYATFLAAEHLLHVSGVMAVVAAGLVAGSYGSTKVSPSVVEFMHSFWEYTSFIMNSLIFFFVGLVIVRQLSLADVGRWAPVLGAVLVAALLVRAAGVYGTVPLLSRWIEPIDRRYQTVMVWGGLRGAVSLALALVVFGHPELPREAREGVLALAAGVVVFTLLVNALSMEPLLRRLGLDRPTPVDRFALAHAERERVRAARAVLARLAREGAVLPGVLAPLEEACAARDARAASALGDLASELGADPGLAEELASYVALALEKGEVLARFQAGQLSEAATRILLASADALEERVERGAGLPEDRELVVGLGEIESRFLSLVEPLPLLGRVSRSLRARRLAETVEAQRALALCARAVQRALAALERDGGLDPRALAQVQARVSGWVFRSEERLHRLVEAFPEYAAHSQILFAELETLRAERRALAHLAEAGLLTEKAHATAKAELLAREAECLRRRPEGIDLSPERLLRAVPAFSRADPTHLAALAQKLVSRTFLEGETVVREGEPGDSMFLIARGAVRVVARGEDEAEVPLSTLGRGAFFGELGALLGGRRTATVRAITPVNLLELGAAPLREVLAAEPELAEAVRASVLPRTVGRALASQVPVEVLGEAARADLAQAFGEVFCAAGERLAAAEGTQRLIYVADGELTLGGRVCAPGCLLGLGAFAERPWGAPLVARTDARLFVLEPDELAAFRARHPAAADALARRAPVDPTSEV